MEKPLFEYFTHRDVPPQWHMKGLAQRFLSDRPHKIGESVQMGWFWFRIADDANPPELESLDFKEIASFTRDFTAAENIRDQQWHTLCRCEVEEQPCTFCDIACVSRSYSPGRRGVFLERTEAAFEGDSGWYVGVTDEERSMEDPASVEFKTLYELTIRDMRLAPYWLLPSGRLVLIDSGTVYDGRPS